MRIIFPIVALLLASTACKSDFFGKKETKQQDVSQGANQSRFPSTNGTGNTNIPPTQPPTGVGIPSTAGNGNGLGIPSETECIEATAAVCAIEKRILDLTNQLRASNGQLPPLSLSPQTAYVARDWSQKMFQSLFISHLGFPRKRQQVYQEKFNSSISFQAENVAMGFVNLPESDTEGVAQYFYDMWRNSSGHRRNMLGNFQYLGVGVYQSGNRWYATQIFY